MARKPQAPAFQNFMRLPSQPVIGRKPPRPEVKEGGFTHDAHDFPLSTIKIEIVEFHIGEGAQGSVKGVAVSPIEGGWKDECALKSVRILSNEREKCLREVNVIRRMSHENIVKLLGYSIGTCDVDLYMERMAASFDDVLKMTRATGTAIPENVIRVVAVSTFRALLSLFDTTRALHNDVKPGNILLSRDGVVKLADFGLATVTNTRGYAMSGRGTEFYLPPEALEPNKEGARHDCRVDVWALGLTLLHLASGRFPYGQGNEGLAQIGLLIQQSDAPPIPAGISEPLRSFITACLLKDPLTRPFYVERSRNGATAPLKDHALLSEALMPQTELAAWYADLRRRPEANAVAQTLLPADKLVLA